MIRLEDLCGEKVKEKPKNMDYTSRGMMINSGNDILSKYGIVYSRT